MGIRTSTFNTYWYTNLFITDNVLNAITRVRPLMLFRWGAQKVPASPLLTAAIHFFVHLPLYGCRKTQNSSAPTRTLLGDQIWFGDRTKKVLFIRERDRVLLLFWGARLEIGVSLCSLQPYGEFPRQVLELLSTFTKVSSSNMMLTPHYLDKHIMRSCITKKFAMGNCEKWLVEIGIFHNNFCK